MGKLALASPNPKKKYSGQTGCIFQYHEVKGTVGTHEVSWKLEVSFSLLNAAALFDAMFDNLYRLALIATALLGRAQLSKFHSSTVVPLR
ncbi:hypothetical protein VNO78_18186 [Psophocarpus tetragonolobus]|uniref:Uncharacterized protein n=1 Tax=Psophocarpus tetragonolobus TaxID=3891 RepID=A0AAN9SPG4_PSOTE